MAETNVPAGWRLVPIEPTEAMIQAHFEAHAQAETVFADVPDVWSAMLAAAPSPPDPLPGSGVVTDAMVNAAWNEAKTRRMTGLPNDFRAVLEAALSAAPAQEGR